MNANKINKIIGNNIYQYQYKVLNIYHLFSFGAAGLHDYPSQNGFFFVNLHPHKFTSFTFSYIENLYGLNYVPLWL